MEVQSIILLTVLQITKFDGIAQKLERLIMRNNERTAKSCCVYESIHTEWH